ncbi:MAG: prepilin-type N-terminal cleavage/methylation domain-containing protein [Bdellovibrionales bacterium]|nr:prepilin-type N-terminal cleavage/methylation domain-containing protein [Bdellovibrionales bacterium]
MITVSHLSVRNESGLTLLEVVIATAILAVLSVYTAESVQNAVRSKVKVEKEVDRVTGVRDALRIMERDINLAFHYRDINVDLYNLAEKERLERLKKGPDKSNEKKEEEMTEEEKKKAEEAKRKAEEERAKNGDQPAKEFKPKQQKIFTHFLGNEDSLHFTTLNNSRIRNDDKSSDQGEVGYFLKDCRSRFNKKAKSQCLWRRLDPIIDDDVEKGGTETVLLEHVERFELRYLGPGKEEDWVKQWKTDKGDESQNSKFPYAVEITLEYHNKDVESEKAVAMTLVAAVRFPNNKTEEPADGKAQEANPELPADTSQ